MLIIHASIQQIFIEFLSYAVQDKNFSTRDNEREVISAIEEMQIY